MNPYRIEGPAVIAFSGGRTSGYMLRHIIDAHGGQLPDDVVPVFCNTGKEHDATLDFVRDCADRWNVAIRWVEWVDHESPAERFREVTHATASRDGTPFAALIKRKGFMPQPLMRFCTTELKIHATHRYVKSALGFDNGYVKAVGLRVDEPRRVSRMTGRNDGGRDGWQVCCPLADAGVTVADVTAFWESHPFDLGLPNADGVTPLGNCDLCFLKSAGKVKSIIAMNPERAVWWAKQEAEMGRPFRIDRPSYAAMLAQGTMFAGDDEDALDCACTD